MTTRPHLLEGRVTDRLNNTPVATVLVEAWDYEEKFSEVLASAVTDKLGTFTLSFDQELLEKAFTGRSARIALKLFYRGSRLAFAPSDQEIVPGTSDTPLNLTVKMPQAYAGDNIYQHLPPDLRSELEGLKKHTDAVLEKLKDEKTRQAFLEDPGRVLAEMGVPLSARLRQRMMTQLPPKSVITPRAFRLLNGQILTPKIRINFTSGKKEGSHGR